MGIPNGTYKICEIDLNGTNGALVTHDTYLIEER